MKNFVKESLITIGLLIIVIPIQLYLPGAWWMFLIVLIPIGMLINMFRLTRYVFIIGFVSGALSWVIPSLYYRSVFGGGSFEFISELTELSIFMIYVLVAMVGGVLTGLALFTGSKIIKPVNQEKEYHLD